MGASATGDSWFLSRRDGEDCVAATAIYDADGTCLANSWTDFISFEYLTEAQWLAGEERSGQNARAVFRREKLTETGWELVQDSGLTFDAAALCLIGSFDGVELVPTEILYIDWETFQTYLYQQGSGSYTVSQVVQDWSIGWQTLYRDDDALSQGGEIITLYADRFDLCVPRTSPAFSYCRQEYANVAALLEELGPTLAGGRQSLSRYEGADLLILSANYCYTCDGETCYSAYYTGEDRGGALQFYLVSAVWCSPWRTALRELRDVYVGTLLLAVAVVLAVRSIAKRHLIQPVQAVGDTLVSGEEDAWLYPKPSDAWQESRRLQEGLDAMVLELLDLSRLEAGRVKLARDEFSLAALTRTVFERLELAMQGKGLHLELDQPEDCVITADQARMEQVVENLAANAVKYTHVGGIIRVHLAASPRMTRFAVENDSEPLSNEALDQVWDSFYRGDAARSEAGTELGLAIAKSIIQLHGGKCGVRNTKTGVEFSFVL